MLMQKAFQEKLLWPKEHFFVYFAGQPNGFIFIVGKFSPCYTKLMPRSPLHNPL